MTALQSAEPTVGTGLSGAKALSKGLAILRILVEANGPMTSTEVARHVGLHQSSASRILKALCAEGYVRKPAYHSFAPDYGILTMRGMASQHFQLVRKPRKAVTELAEKCEGLSVCLGVLWRGQMLYLMRAEAGHEPIESFTSTFPLHLSSPGMRLLLELPHKEALDLLMESKRRRGWERPTKNVPPTPAACLREARKLLRHDCLFQMDWMPNRPIGAAIPVKPPEGSGEPPVALALSGPKRDITVETVLLWLQEGRRAIEEALRA